ncbi:CHRD domain-containing protein [Spirillospora sp. CA-294931]|uniref:CHRD domain-containing protein n=1 Tax=Spirillospora sp. CA-294931 TaxID=3240042 RepID=UPI003D8F5EBD
MTIRKFVLPTVSAAALVAMGAVGVTAANALGDSEQARHGSGHGHAAQPVSAELPVDEAPSGTVTYLAASLQGRNEVPAADGSAVGDRDGRAHAVLRIQGDRVWYALRWQNIAAPTAGHIHLGARGVNGAVKVPFFAGTLPGSARAVAGSVQVTDKETLKQIKDNANGFYANLHTADFPGGAVRGQLHRLNRPADLNGVLRGSSAATLQALGDGAQEVPAKDGKATGDPDGRSTAFARSHDGMVSWGFTWSAVSPPTLGHIHRGARGANGPVAADLFAAPQGLPATVTGLAGMTPVKHGVASQIMRRPADFYTNLHTAEFPGGAVRGQLAPASGAAVRASLKPVLQGAQVYRCTLQADGTFAFTQDNVRAVLEDGIAHTFVQPGPQGPPQWVAPDRSAVTGKAVARTPNGAANIPELVLDATKSGADKGLFSGTQQILRLNTIGGVAPKGTCAPSSLAKVPYKADYLFLD